MSTTGNYRPRFLAPARFARGRATVATLPVDLDSVLTAPDSGSVVLSRPDGTEASAQSVTVTGSVAQFSVTLGASEILAEGWTLVWTLVFGSVTHVWWQPAACVRYVPTRTVSTPALLQRHPELASEYAQGDPAGDNYIEAAEQMFEDWLTRQGRRPELVVSDGTSREPVIQCALMLWFRSLIREPGDRWSLLADEYKAGYADALAQVKPTYDADESGTVTEDEKGRPSGPLVTFLSDPPRGFSGGY